MNDRRRLGQAHFNDIFDGEGQVDFGLLHGRGTDRTGRTATLDNLN